MITFETPSFAIFFILLPFFIYLFHFSSFLGGKVLYSFSTWGKTNPFSKEIPFLRIMNILAHSFFWLAYIFMVIALMGPSYSRQKIAYLDRGIDIFFVLDESPSMGALDFGTMTRLEEALNLIKNFVKTTNNDAVGLITFASDVVVRSPLTQNYEFILDKLNDTYIMDLGEETSLGDALALALFYMTYSTANNKVIVLMTDGVLNKGIEDIKTLINIAQKAGVRVYTIGIGTSELVPVSFKTREGKQVRGTVKESYDEAMLRQIALGTGGQYFEASSGYLLSSALGKITSLEETEKRIRLDVFHTSLISIFMIWAFIFICLYFILKFFILDTFL